MNIIKNYSYIFELRFILIHQDSIICHFHLAYYYTNKPWTGQRDKTRLRPAIFIFLGTFPWITKVYHQLIARTWTMYIFVKKHSQKKFSDLLCFPISVMVEVFFFSSSTYCWNAVNSILFPFFLYIFIHNPLCVWCG